MSDSEEIKKSTKATEEQISATKGLSYEQEENLRITRDINNEIREGLKLQKQETPIQPPPPQLAPQSLPPVRPQQQPTPNLQGIYQGPTTPLVDANVPIASNTFEPMAANETMGGGFGSAF